MNDFWILLLVKVHRWCARKISQEIVRKLARDIERNRNLHRN